MAIKLSAVLLRTNRNAFFHLQYQSCQDFYMTGHPRTALTFQCICWVFWGEDVLYLSTQYQRGPISATDKGRPIHLWCGLRMSKSNLHFNTNVYIQPDETDSYVLLLSKTYFLYNTEVEENQINLWLVFCEFRASYLLVTP